MADHPTEDERRAYALTLADAHGETAPVTIKRAERYFAFLSLMAEATAPANEDANVIPLRSGPRPL